MTLKVKDWCIYLYLKLLNHRGCVDIQLCILSCKEIWNYLHIPPFIAFSLYYSSQSCTEHVNLLHSLFHNTLWMKDDGVISTVQSQRLPVLMHISIFATLQAMCAKNQLSINFNPMKLKCHRAVLGSTVLKKLTLFSSEPLWTCTLYVNINSV